MSIFTTPGNSNLTPGQMRQRMKDLAQQLPAILEKGQHQVLSLVTIAQPGNHDRVLAAAGLKRDESGGLYLAEPNPAGGLTPTLYLSRLRHVIGDFPLVTRHFEHMRSITPLAVLMESSAYGEITAENSEAGLTQTLYRALYPASRSTGLSQLQLLLPVFL